jgi:ligand-binding sensor domain-containing protein/signal transduction histidine kinase
MLVSGPDRPGQSMPINHRKLSGAWLLLCAMAFLFPPGAGAADPSGSPFIVDVWTSKEGLPENAVISVIQTRDGYLWLGTLNGLVRFDGNHFTVFNEHNTPGLNSDRIVYLFEDSHTNLWIGTDAAGAALVQDGKIKNFDIGRPGHEGRLVSVCEDVSGTVWLYTADARLGRYQNGKLETLNFNFNPLGIYRMITAEKSGPLWIGEYGAGEPWGQIFSFQPSNFHPPALPIDQLIRVEKLDFILAGQRGGTWRLINGRVQKWSVTQLEKDFGAYPWGNATVTTAGEDHDGNLIVGTRGAGVFWYDADGKYQHISTDQGLSSAFVLSLCTDGQGNLWVGTDGNGLDRVKRKAFGTPAELHPWAAQSLFEDAQGGLWMAFNAQGVTHWLASGTQDFGVGRGSNAWTVLVDQQQRVWAGTRGEGLFQFQTNHFQQAPGAEIPGPQIFALFEDPNGQLWAGTRNGLARWNGEDWKIYKTPDGLVVRAIAGDADGNLWVGTENHGLNFFKDGKFISHQKSEDGLPGNDISCLYLDKEGVLWVGTSGHGLARFDRGKWQRYSTDDGLASNSIDYIIEDDEGCLWIGSNAGLMRIQKNSLSGFHHGRGNLISCRTYVETDGLPTRECSAGSQPAACRTRDGRLWFPTTKGVVSVNPADIKTNRQPPLVMIESVLVDGQEQKTNRFSSAWLPSVAIPPGREQLEIHYTGLNFSAPGQVRFKYRLEGHETAWTEAGDARVAYYPNVPPGDYRFHVIAGNEDGVWNETGGVLAVTVQPQFWQTWWFRVAVILCLAGIVVAVVRYLSTQKLRRQLQLHEHQEALEKERSRIARDLHDQLGANLTQVALLGEMAEADKNSPAEIESDAQQISQTARETTRALDEIVWAVNPSNDTLEGLVNYVCKYAQEYLALAGVRYRAEVPTQLPAVTLPPEVRHNVFLAFKEAVNNVVKHAQASEVWVRLRLHPDHLILSIEDNGRGPDGMDTNAAQARNGLRNMKKRMDDIGGKFEIGAASDRGTIVCLTVPVGTK